MVAYNFMKRFREPILAGTKRHTIRKNGKRKHAKAGDKLQLYTGMRHPGCEKIIDAICLGSYPLTIRVSQEGFALILDGKPVEDKDKDKFAVADGFDSAADMHQFWLDVHGEGEHNYTLIQWGDKDNPNDSENSV